MSFMENIAAAVAEAATHTDYNEAEKGGNFERVLPAAGLTRLRLVTYIETGAHYDEKYKKTKQGVVMQFELSGPKHPPTTLDDGRVLPIIITINESLSKNEKANFFKLFRRMNHTGEHKIMAQMLGADFLGTVVITEPNADGKSYANLRDDGGYTIRPPFIEDAETGESKRIAVTAALSPLKCFIWDFATKEMWDSIFVDGMWDARTDDKGTETAPARSKNVYQLKIRAATNFAGSPMDVLLGGGGDALELGEAEKPKRGKAAVPADPLEGVA